METHSFAGDRCRLKPINMAEDGGGGVVKRMRSDYFDEEIVFEILARLPVRSILRFRCVCKSWREMIAGSHFVQKQLSCAEGGNNNSRLLFLQNRPHSIDYEALKDLKEAADGGWFANRQLQFPVTLTVYRLEHKIVRVLGACNGLVCVESQGVGIVLWNPCTGVSKVLPAPPTDPHPEDFYGFGYDSTTDDYKVIRGSRSSEESLMHLFTLKKGSWRTIRDLDNVECQGKGCLFNGALHWLVPTGRRPRIMSLSVSEEKFEETVSVRDLGCSYLDSVLVYKDHLCVCKIVPGCPAFLWLWSMEEYGAEKSWTPVIELSFKKGIGEVLRPLCILQNGEVLMQRIVDPDDPFALDDPEEDPYDEINRLYHEQLMEDPDVFDEPDVYEDPYELDRLYHEQLMEDPHVFDEPDVYEDPYELDRLYHEQLMEDPDEFDEPDVYEDPYELDRLYHEQLMMEDPDVDEDPYVELDKLYNEQLMSEDPGVDEDPYVELDRLYHEQLMSEDPDVDEDPYVEFDRSYNQQRMWEAESLLVLKDQKMSEDPDVDEDPYVEFDRSYNQQRMWEAESLLVLKDQKMSEDPDVDEDPYVEFDRSYNQQRMWEAESLLVLKDQKTSKAVFEVDFGFGAAIYRETLVSPINLVGPVEI